jgi:ADP-heptose:LPS heptosyltransferase
MFSRLDRVGMGDYLQRNVFLSLLKQACPGARLTWVVGVPTAARAYLEDTVRHHSHADEVVLCPAVGNTDAAAWKAFTATLPGYGFDVCVVDPGSDGLGVRDAADAGIPVRVSITGNGEPDEYITHPIRLSGDADLLDYATGLAEVLGMPHLPAPERLVSRLPYRREPQPAWVSGSGPLVGVHAGGAAGWHRRWPLERYAEVASRAVTGFGATIVLLGDPSDAADTATLHDAILRRSPAAQVHRRLGGPVNALAGLVDELDLLVGNDSGPAHLAAALATPTVVVYGPTTDAMWARIYPHHRRVDRRFPCQTDVDAQVPVFTQCRQRCPCHYRPDGPVPHCLAAVTVDDVWEAVLSLLGPPPRAV